MHKLPLRLSNCSSKPRLYCIKPPRSHNATRAKGRRKVVTSRARSQTKREVECVNKVAPLNAIAWSSTPIRVIGYETIISGADRLVTPIAGGTSCDVVPGKYFQIL